MCFKCINKMKYELYVKNIKLKRKMIWYVSFEKALRTVMDIIYQIDLEENNETISV